MVRKHKKIWQQIWEKWKAEFLALLLVGLGIFLLLEPLALRSMLWLWGQGLWQIGVELAQSFFSSFAQFWKLSNAIAILLIFWAGTILLSRLRSRLMNAPRYTERKCPVCGSAIYKRHRGWFGHAVSAIIPVRRYACKRCHWQGWRISQYREESLRELHKKKRFED